MAQFGNVSSLQSVSVVETSSMKLPRATKDTTQKLTVQFSDEPAVHEESSGQVQLVGGTSNVAVADRQVSICSQHSNNMDDDEQSTEKIRQAVEQMLEHSKRDRQTAADRISYSFLGKSKPPPVNKDKAQAWTWESISSMSGLEDTSPEAEEQRAELIRRVFTYELMNSNANYRRYIHGLQQSSTGLKSASSSGYETGSALLEGWNKWKYSETRERVYLTLSHPEHSHTALMLNCLFVATIILNIVTFCIETIPSIERDGNASDILTDIDYLCLAIFTVEYMGRLISCPALWPFIKSPMNMIDFLAIMPFYIELMVVGPNSGGGASQTRILRLIRLLRILRLLRLWTRFQNLSVIVDALVSSLDILGMLAFLLLVILIVFSTVVYYIEQDTNPLLDSIPQTMYFVQTTLTTTGYGDITPVTYQGKLIVGVLMLFAMVTLALPISVIGANFTNMWTDYKTMKRAAERSAKVWPNFRDLNQSLEQHKSVLDDVMYHCKVGQAGIDVDVAALREASQKARLLYLMRVTQGQGPGWEADMIELRASLISMKARLATARERWDELEAVMGVSAMTRADDFMLKLDRMHLAYKNLRKWFEEGVYMVQEVKLLTDDIQNLKQHLQSGSGPGNDVPLAAPATAGPEGAPAPGSAAFPSRGGALGIGAPVAEGVLASEAKGDGYSRLRASTASARIGARHDIRSAPGIGLGADGTVAAAKVEQGWV